MSKTKYWKGDFIFMALEYSVAVEQKLFENKRLVAISCTKFMYILVSYFVNIPTAIIGQHKNQTHVFP